MDSRRWERWASVGEEEGRRKSHSSRGDGKKRSSNSVKFSSASVAAFLFPAFGLLLLLFSPFASASGETSVSFDLAAGKAGRGAETLTCISCLQCKVYEASSQTAACNEEQNMCLRADMASGEVERRCATERDCLSAKDGSTYERVSCCNWSNCNGASSSMVAHGMGYLFPFAYKLISAHFFSYFLEP